jgi:type IV secretion system protein VirB2
MKATTQKAMAEQAKILAVGLLKATVLTAVLTMPALAQQDFAGTDLKVCGFFDNIQGLLNMASIAVVTIAIIFAGYQIAFAHKRIGDVAPLLIGGLLIGAATQVAKMLLPEATECTGGTVMLMEAVYSRYA